MPHFVTRKIKRNCFLEKNNVFKKILDGIRKCPKYIVQGFFFKKRNYDIKYICEKYGVLFCLF